MCLGFYDPDGYFFNEEGFDEYGGYYDEEGLYYPGEKNKHEFPHLLQQVKEDNHRDNRRGGKSHVEDHDIDNEDEEDELVK